MGCQDSFMHHHNAVTHPSSFIPIFLSQYDLPSKAPISTLDLSLDKNGCTLVQTRGWGRYIKYIYSGLYENTNPTSTNMLLSREIHLTKALGQHCMAEAGTLSLAILPRRESYAHQHLSPS